MTLHPLVILVIGIAVVLGMIIRFKINAFLALITAAVVVSLLSCINQPDDLPNSINRVAEAFGGGATSIGIVIALAAIIGQCMMDSGAADRIVRAFLNLLGEKRSPWALMGSGYILAVPVFFDTVFYLLVPLARSFYKRTKKNYLLCILAIAAGGAITHTLVPPTPGPLVMAAQLNIDLGVMIMVGALVALPSAIVGITFARILDRRMEIPLRTVAGEEERAPLRDEELPGLFVSLLPVLLPVFLIACHTIADTMEKDAAPTQKKQLAALTLEQSAHKQLADAFGKQLKDTEDPALKSHFEAKLKSIQMELDAVQEKIDAVEIDLAEKAGIWSSATHYTAMMGNANFALLISAAIAILLLVKQRKPSLTELSQTIELSLMSAGVIILITAAGTAFGAMLKVAQIGPAIEKLFGGSSGEGLVLLTLGFGIAVLLKIAQGSSTAAMIVGSAMLASMIEGSPPPFHPVYLATAIGGGSLVGSWMKDSGFWIFAKMGGLTETEALKSWTPMLVLMGVQVS
jgi:H+/gluconate symporter-like permease